MQTIMLQQLELHFGDEFQERYNKAKSYVKGLIGKGWWVDKSAMLGSEGPLSRMVEDCLSHVIEKDDDVIAGYQSYTSYLTKLYGTSYPSAASVSTEEAYNRSGFLWTTLGAYNNPSLLGDETVVEDQVHDEAEEMEFFDDAQAEFLEVYITLGPAAAAEIFNMTPQQAFNRRRTIRHTIKARVARAERNS